MRGYSQENIRLQFFSYSQTRTTIELKEDGDDMAKPESRRRMEKGLPPGIKRWASFRLQSDTARSDSRSSYLVTRFVTN